MVEIKYGKSNTDGDEMFLDTYPLGRNLRPRVYAQRRLNILVIFFALWVS
jgi:hypothetical protein